MKTIFYTFIILLFISSCKNNESYEVYMSNIRQVNPQIKEGEWKVDYHYDLNGEENYHQYLIQGDTVFKLDLFIYSKEHMKMFNFRNKYFFSYTKEYNNDDYKYILYMVYSDTMYFYRTPINNNEEKYFYTGKYYYLDENIKLTLCQREYYLKHVDSLVKVKGNDVPDLPCPEDSIK